MAKVAVDDFGFGFNVSTGEVLVSPIRTLFMPSLPVGLDCSGESSLTVQADLPGTDLNVIMAQYERTGFDAYEDRKASGGFVDLASMPDFLTAQNTVVAANEAFDSLPAHLRKRFNNSPADFLAFFDDDANMDEAVKLGLATAPAPPEPKATNPADSSSSSSSGASEDA